MTSSPVRLLWHASRHDIQRPTVAGRVAGVNAENSGLGLFCATVPRDYISGFGPWVHEIVLHDELRVLRMDITTLAGMGRWEDRAWFEAEGRRLAQDYDVIELIEIDGRCEQVIVLRDAAIADSRRLTAEQFKALSDQEDDTPLSRKRPGALRP